MLNVVIILALILRPSSKTLAVEDTFRIEYWNNADEIIAITYDPNAITYNPDGTVTVDLTITDKKNIVYDLIFDSSGSVTGPINAPYMPLVPRKSWSIPITFREGSSLTLLLSKGGHTSDGTILLLSLDLAVAFWLAKYEEDLPSNPEDLIPSLEDILDLIPHSAIDLTTAFLWIQQDHYDKAIEEVIDAALHSPETVGALILIVTGAEIPILAITATLQLIKLLSNLWDVRHFLWDLLTAPSEAQAGITWNGVFPPPPSPPPPPPPPPTADNATFTDVENYPDHGPPVSAGQTINKWWRMRNTGTSTWNAGYRLVFVGGDRMNALDSVSLPRDVAPGEEVDISVNMTAPSSGGSYRGNWRMRNAQGTYFGDPIWVKISVVDSTSGDHIAEFSADPPSPSSASTVRLSAKVNWWPQFRAMRVRVDNQIIGETAAAEHTFDWNAGNASRGDHTIVLEVADQTDTSWSHPERRVMVYTLRGTSGPVNHAPNRPNPSSPYDWYVYYSGNTAQLCAQANGDPDGDAITGYYFDIYDSAQLWNSGWVGNSCMTTSALGPYNYQWRVKVRDSQGAESEWSDTWHLTLVNPSLSISELYFEPQDGKSEQVKIRACTTGQGGVGITMRVSVNDANDGSGNGTWHIIKELGVPCFNEIDAPIWHTLEYGDGPHRVRAEGHGRDASWDGAAVREEVYTLPPRRPPSTRLLAPVPPSRHIREAIYLNSRTITFRWEPTIRANSYTLHVGTSPSPKDDPNPIFRQTFDSSVTQHTVTFSQDHPALYWQVSPANGVGTNASGDQLFGIDHVAPSCTVQALPATTYESVFQVNWNGSDDLSGIRSFDVQYLDSDRGTWSDWLTNVSASKTYELFTGQPGHTYAFRCRATDNANNRGNYPGNADTFTRVDPPVIGSPNLAVLSLGTYPNAEGGVIVQAIVENQGDVSTQNGFYSDLYLDHLPAGAGDYTGSIKFWVNDPIAAGATVTLTTVITDLADLLGTGLQSIDMPTETTGTLYAQADSGGAVAETDDLNNIYSAGTEVCVASPDVHEEDDVVGSATLMGLGQSQDHNFDAPGDQDWIRFVAGAGEEYLIRTAGLGVRSDTYLYLYDTDGTTLLAANDDYAGSLASQIEWTAASNGSYYVLVKHWNPNVGGCGTGYTLSVQTPEQQFYLPLIQKGQTP